jgi:hypothetical protein
MKKQSEIVSSRKLKAARLSKVCQTPKAYQMKKLPKSSVLFGYANKETYLEIAKTKMGLAFIEKHLVKFQTFARQVCKNVENTDSDLHQEIGVILEGQALENYTRLKVSNKADEERYRTHAMGIVLQYSNLQIPVMTQESLGTWLRIVEIRTSCIICSDNQTYELLRTIEMEHGWAQFNCKEQFVRVDKRHVEVASLLIRKLGLGNIVAQIMILADRCTIRPDPRLRSVNPNK